VRLGILLLTLAVMAITAAVALAANVTGDGTLVGSPGNDNIAAGNGPDTIWGLGGSDNITAGTGSDVIDGGGTCVGTLAPGDYPHGLPGANYCQHGPNNDPGTDNIVALTGSDTVYGNSGRNNIVLGSGKDTVFAFGGPNSVVVGNGTDTINAYGTGTYATGTGKDTVNAQFSRNDIITCGSSHTTVFAVKNAGDIIAPPCTVKFVAPQPVPGSARAATARKLAAKRAA